MFRYAAKSGSVTIVETLLRNTQVLMNINWMDNTGKSAVEYASSLEVRAMLAHELIRDRLKGTAKFIKNFGMKANKTNARQQSVWSKKKKFRRRPEREKIAIVTRNINAESQRLKEEEGPSEVRRSMPQLSKKRLQWLSKQALTHTNMNLVEIEARNLKRLSGSQQHLHPEREYKPMKIRRKS